MNVINWAGVLLLVVMWLAGATWCGVTASQPSWLLAFWRALKFTVVMVIIATLGYFSGWMIQYGR